MRERKGLAGHNESSHAREGLRTPASMHVPCKPIAFGYLLFLARSPSPMSHVLDLDGVTERLVLLQHLAYGSKQYCAVRGTGSHADAGNGDLDECWSWTKAIVSNRALECAVRVRALLDVLEEHQDLDATEELDQNARNGLLERLN
jgi:hypothetical protein